MVRLDLEFCLISVFISLNNLIGSFLISPLAALLRESHGSGHFLGTAGCTKDEDFTHKLGGSHARKTDSYLDAYVYLQSNINR